MSTALAVRQLSADKITVIMSVAPVMHTARLFGTTSPEQAAAIMMKGFELGFSLTSSFENIAVIEGKPTLSPKGCLALIYGSPECSAVRIKDIADDKGMPVACEVFMERTSGFSYTVRFTMADAERAGLIKDKSGWQKYPANMLRWRAIGYCADVVFPDVIGGTKRADEFGADISPTGEVIEGSWNQVGSQPSQEELKRQVEDLRKAQQQNLQAAVTVSQTPAYNPNPNRLTQLTATYGATAILEANGGKIPSDDSELDSVELILGVAK